MESNRRKKHHGTDERCSACGAVLGMKHMDDCVAISMDLTAAEMAAQGKRVWEPAQTEFSNHIADARGLLERALILTRADYQKRRGSVVQPLHDDIKAWLG